MQVKQPSVRRAKALAPLELLGHPGAAALHGRLSGCLSRGVSRRGDAGRPAWLLHRRPGQPQQAQLLLLAHLPGHLQLPRGADGSPGQSRVPLEEIGSRTKLPLGDGRVRPGVDPELVALSERTQRAQRGIEAGRTTAGHQAEAERPVSCERKNFFETQPKVSCEINS